MPDEMTSKERFINALELKEVDRVPLGYLWFGAGDAVLEVVAVGDSLLQHLPQPLAILGVDGLDEEGGPRVESVHAAAPDLGEGRADVEDACAVRRRETGWAWA